MISYLNRILEVYRNWEQEESKLRVLDGLQPKEKDMLKAKYDFLRKGVYRVEINPSVGELLALGVMKGALSKLEKQIYPNRFLRAVHQVKVTLIDRPNYIDRFRKFKEENLRQVDSVLKLKGLDHYFGKLEQYLDYERSAVQIDFTAALNEHTNVSFRINIEKNSNGGYQMESLHASIRNTDQPERDRHFDFDKDYDVNPVKATNLLMGRAILNGAGEFNHNNTNQWIQLENVNDPDHYGIKVFLAEQGFDLKRALNDFASETGIYRVISADVIAQLQEGHQVKLTGIQPLDQSILIEASPSTKGILIRDHEQNIIRKDELFMSAKKALEKERGNRWMTSHKSKDKNNQQDQSLGIGS